MEKKNSYIKEYIRGNWKYSIVFLLVFMALGCVSTGLQNLTPVDFIFLITKGFSYQKFRLTEFLYYLFFYIYPLFWINYFLENEKKDRNTAAKFRYGSMQRWKCVLLKESMGYMLYYYLQFIACAGLVDTVLVMVRHDKADEYFFAIMENYGVHTEGVYLGFALALLWRLVELLLLLEIDLCIYQYFEDNLIAFLGTFTVYLLGAVFRGGNILIVGLSAAYGAFEIIATKQMDILAANILAGIFLVLLLFVVQIRKIGNWLELWQRWRGGRHGFFIQF